MTHPKPFWLHPEKRRRLKDVGRYLGPRQIHALIMKGTWQYKTQLDYYRARDRAFLSLMFESGLRVCEVIAIRKDQFDFSDSQFIIIKDVEIKKRKAKTIQREGIPKIDVVLPLEGELADFTALVETYYRVCETERLFPFGTKRAWAITKHITGKWNHYFRSQRISDMMNRQDIPSSDRVAKIVGIKNPQTIAHYYKGSWKEAREELLK